MEFGRVPVQQLECINFSLPEEPNENIAILPGIRSSNAKIYLGCPSWARPEWVGKVYPAKTNSNNFLQHYTKQFNSIELNATHYKIYEEDTIQQWAAKANGKDFLFCPKVYQGITHDGLLSNKQVLTQQFISSVSAFGKHLGPILIQLSDSFSPARQAELFTFLEWLPADKQFFLEVRHAAWFANTDIRTTLFQLLSSKGIGAVITDTASRRDCAHLQLSIRKAFVRFVGNSLHPSDFSRADEWVQQVKRWIDKGLEELYFFIHMQEEITSPDLVQYFATAFTKHTGLSVAPPTFVVQQKGLFD